MAMEQIGYVVEVLGTDVKVRVVRESACGGNCGACHGCPSGAVFVTCANDIDVPFMVGEEVVVEMPAKQFFGGTLGSYGIMTLCMLLGAILGYLLTKYEAVSVLGGFLGLVVGILLMRVFFQGRQAAIKVKRQNEMRKQ
ncbi:MAG: SoxR reducing system RseC family protein [Clostridia bacterium]|nr:SoxR reducing system RseC family protein [Clostridia bacterium]